MRNKIIQGDCLEVLKTFPDESIDMCITSPPYWALRDYGTANWDGGDKDCDHTAAKEKSRYDYSMESSSNQSQRKGTDAPKWKDKCPKCGAKKVDLQLGLESTFQEYIDKLCDIFDEVKRVLKKSGTCWVNLGDTYNSSQAGNKTPSGFQQKSEEEIKAKAAYKRQKAALPDKCLLQIPSRFAIEMTNRGWILRNEIIWHKPSCMPSSIIDRFTVDFEKLFFFVKNKKYWFETQYERATSTDNSVRDRDNSKLNNTPGRTRMGGLTTNHYIERNKRAVWSINPKGYTEAHFAVYPEKLIDTPIKAGCPKEICKNCGVAREKIIIAEGGTIGESWHDHKDDQVVGQRSENKAKGGHGYKRIDEGYSDCGCKAGWNKGIVLDPFMGSGTTAFVARKHSRDYLGIELNAEYIKLVEKRLAQQILL